VKHLINADRMYDIYELLKLKPADFEKLDSRVTTVNGIPDRGDRVVITDKITGRDVSESLSEWETDALLRHLSTAFSDLRCLLHRPYDRLLRRSTYDPAASCTCAKVFHSRLLARYTLAKANSVSSIHTEIRGIADQARRS
jgi:hypothetical protein